MFIYDFDHPDEWVHRFTAVVAPNAEAILSEIEARSIWDRDRSNPLRPPPKPASPATEGALSVISSDFAENAFRCFHATRLPTPNCILDEGLKALEFDKQLARVEAENSGGAAAAPAQSISDLTTLRGEREGYCWLTPSREYLHNGDLDAMFDRFGGEAVAVVHGTREVWPDDQNGEPTVVVAAIPTDWCYWAPERGPRRILFEVMAHLGHPLRDAFAKFWDVEVSRDIPAEMIERVCGRDDARVANPPRKSGF